MSYLESPPNLTGTAEQQLVQMRSYLYRLSEALSVALNQVSGNGTGGTQEQTAAGSGAAADDGGSGFVTLRELIVKTAEIVTVAREEITRTLESSYVAQSEFGTYQSRIETTLTATAEQLGAVFESVETINGELPAIRTSTGYIKAGFIAESAEEKLVGIAIGQTVETDASEQYTDEETGIVYEKVNLGSTQNCAFYTAQGLYFYVNGSQAAYLTNRRMHIVDGEIDNTLTFGNNKWLINHAYSGFSIKWIGG